MPCVPRAASIHTAAPRRYLELDGLRGVAVLVVALCHYGNEFDNYFPGHEPATVAGESVGWLLRYGYFGVQLFFMISGFVILHTARNVGSPRDFVVARTARLYPTYWACLTVTAVAGWLSAEAVLRRTPVETVANFSMMQRFLRLEDVDAAYWSLSVELLFYGVVWMLFVLRGSVDDRTVVAAVPAWLGVALLLATYYQVAEGSTLALTLVILSATQYAALFCAGMLLLLSRGTGRVHPLIIPCFAVQAVVSWLIVDWVEAVIAVILMLAFTLTVMTPHVPVLTSRPLVFVGSISFPLYLLHQNLGYLVIDKTVDSVGRWPAMALAIVATGMLAWVAHRTIEGPLSREARRLLSRQRLPATTQR